MTRYPPRTASRSPVERPRSRPAIGPRGIVPEAHRHAAGTSAGRSRAGWCWRRQPVDEDLQQRANRLQVLTDGPLVLDHGAKGREGGHLRLALGARREDDLDSRKLTLPVGGVLHGSVLCWGVCVWGVTSEYPRRALCPTRGGSLPASDKAGLCRLEKASNVLGVEKCAEEEPSGRRFLAWVVRHLGGTCGRDLQPVE